MLSDLLALTQDMIRDHSERVEVDQLARALSLAVAQYGKDRPHRVVEDLPLSVDGSLDYPAGAIDVTSIEYPVGENPPSILKRRLWRVYEAPTGKRILFSGGIPSAATVRVTMAQPHVVTDEDDTTPECDREALASYAAAVLFDQMAADTSADGNPTIQADTVNHQAKPENFSKRAERLRQRYYDLIGLDPKRVKSAGASVSVSPGTTHGGLKMTPHHGRRPR